MKLPERDLYYLRSIKRNLDELHELAGRLTFQPSIGGEVLADNRDWLDCFIEKHSK
jgi:hypothetical protein